MTSSAAMSSIAIAKTTVKLSRTDNVFRMNPMIFCISEGKNTKKKVSTKENWKILHIFFQKQEKKKKNAISTCEVLFFVRRWEGVRE